MALPYVAASNRHTKWIFCWLYSWTGHLQLEPMLNEYGSKSLYELNSRHKLEGIGSQQTRRRGKGCKPSPSHT